MGGTSCLCYSLMICRQKLLLGGSGSHRRRLSLHRNTDDFLYEVKPLVDEYVERIFCRCDWLSFINIRSHDSNSQYIDWRFRQRCRSHTLQSRPMKHRPSLRTTSRKPTKRRSRHRGGRRSQPGKYSTRGRIFHCHMEYCLPPLKQHLERYA